MLPKYPTAAAALAAKAAGPYLAKCPPQVEATARAVLTVMSALCKARCRTLIDSPAYHAANRVPPKQLQDYTLLLLHLIGSGFE